MPDWTKSMKQSFEFYQVDPDTWTDIKRLENIVSASLKRDSGSDTLGSASVKLNGNIGEMYFRAYLVTIQNEITEKFPLGVYLVETPNYSFDGTADNISADAYTPLLELKEKKPPIGYTLKKNNTGIMSRGYSLTKDHLRAPVVQAIDSKLLPYDFTANLDDDWLTYISDLIKLADFKFGLDEYGRIIFVKERKLEGMTPIWTFDSSNSSILYADISVERDLYDIPNVVEVIYSNSEEVLRSVVKNENENSPASIKSRGREILYRDTNPSISGMITQNVLDDYAKELMKKLSKVVCRVTYKHGYCPVRLGDCVRLNYKEAGLDGVNAVVVSQTIECVPGCPVSETAELSYEA